MSKQIVIDEAEAADLFGRGFPVARRPVPKPGDVPGSPAYSSAALRNYGGRTFAEFRDQRHWWGDVPIEWVRTADGRSTQDEAAGHVFRREPFEIGNISGTYAFQPEAKSFFGDLTEFWVKAFDADYREGGIDYVVWSYETVIAWVRVNGGITMPPVRYSNTTTQHQHLVATALGVSFTSTESARMGKGKTPYTSRSGW